jgi:hypothetical protein
MSGRPALFRRRELKEALIAAKKAGAPEVRLHLGGDVAVVIPLRTDDEKPAVDANEWNADDEDKA